MEGEKKRGSRGWWALAGMIGVPTLMLGLYVGAYYATVRVTWMSSSPQTFPVYVPVWLNRYPVFAPIHYADRHWIRPQRWNP